MPCLPTRRPCTSRIKYRELREWSPGVRTYETAKLELRAQEMNLRSGKAIATELQIFLQ